MEEITVVDVKPQLVAGMRKRGHYREIAEMLPRLYEYSVKKGAKFTPRNGKGSEMTEIVEFIGNILIKKGEAPRMKNKVTEFKKRYGKIHYCFDRGKDVYQCFLSKKEIEFKDGFQ